MNPREQLVISRRDKGDIETVLDCWSRAGVQSRERMSEDGEVGVYQ